MNEYQKSAVITALPSAMNLTYLLGGLAVEGTEALDKYVKAVRDNDGIVDEQLRESILKECGDCLWMVAVIAEYFGTDIETIAQKNLDKLASRAARGVLSGSGDNR